MKQSFTLAIIFLFITLSSLAQENGKLIGKWALIPGHGSEIELYRNLHLNIQQQDNKTSLAYKWGNSHFLADTLLLESGKQTKKIIENRVFPTNVFMGLQMAVGTELKANIISSNDDSLVFTVDYTVSGSQGLTPVKEIHTLKLIEYKEILEYRIQRSTRPKGSDITYYLKKKGTREVYYINLNRDWNLRGGLSEKAFLLGLQGLVNRNKPSLYFVYPGDWEFRFTPDVFRFLKDKQYYNFHQLRDLDEALAVFHSQLKGYIIWDKQVRTSLIVAFTLAGIKDGIIITEDKLPLMEKYGLKQLVDLRGKYSGQSDYEIFKSAYNEYGKECNKESIVWLGGVGGTIMKPGIADWGVQQKSFFVNLSTKVSDSMEYALAGKILSDLKPYSMVMGWHSYRKDKERDYVSLTSHYTHRVLGLNTLPNMSFTSKVPVSEGFVFKNNHSPNLDTELKIEKKVYISLIQTDGLGLGAWNQPGRGDIPYAWEVTMNWYWLAPAMLEYFYSQATGNDYFIGALSGPGYIYPKAVPPTELPNLLAIARDLMHKLDLNVFEIMDYSEGATLSGNTELTKDVVDAYYKNMPDALGFVNGYAPAFTFYNKGGRALISYDYYLSPERKKEEVIADLEELANINAKRPYFLLIHVREWSDIARVKEILAGLDNSFEVIHLERFLKMAGSNPSFKENLLKK